MALLRILFIRATHSIWLSALSCSVTSSRSAICFTSRKNISSACLSMSVRCSFSLAVKLNRLLLRFSYVTAHLCGLLFMSGEETDFMRPHGIEACAAWFGKSVCPPPVAEAGRTVLPQRSKNARKSESPKRFSGTARRREAMRPRVQVSPLRP